MKSSCPPCTIVMDCLGCHLICELRLSDFTSSPQRPTQQQTWIRGEKGRGRGRGGGSIASYFCAIPKSAVPALKLLQALASPGVPREKKVWDHDPSAHRAHYRCLLARTPQSKLALCIHGNVKERNREFPV